MAGSQQRSDPQANRNPTQIVPPKIDTRIEIQGPLPTSIPAIEVIPLIPGVVLLIVGITAVLSGTSGSTTGPLLILLGFILFISGLALVFGTNEYSSSRDLIKAGCDFAMAQRKLPFSADETAEKPVHGVTRMYADGMAETIEGHLVGVVQVEPRNTDLMTPSEKSTIATQLTAGIDQDIRKFSFKYFSTTRETDPVEVAEQYEQQAEASRFTGDDWIGVRELLRDISDWYRNKNAADWGTREWQHYVIVRVRPDDVAAVGRQERTKSPADRMVDKLAGQDTSIERKRNRMQSQLTSRLDTVLTRVINNVEGLEGEVLGPEAHALLLAEFWSGTKHDFDPDEFSTEAQLSIWPGATEYPGATSPEEATDSAPGQNPEGTGRHPPTQRPGPVEADETVPPAAEQPGAVGTPTESMGADPGTAGDPSVGGASPRTQPSGGTTDPNEAFDDPEVADRVQWMARIRDALFGGAWPVESYRRWRNGSAPSVDIRQRGERLLQLGDHAEETAETVESDVNGTDGHRAEVAGEDRFNEDRARVDKSASRVRDGDERPIPRDDRLRDILATDYDVRDGVVSIGDQICKTFWIADFPTQPDAHFLNELFTVKGVDMDICIHADARDHGHTVSELEHEIATIGAEVDERAENWDVSSRAVEGGSDAYKLMYDLLTDQNTSAQPWDISGYVTIRAGTRRALDRAEEAIAEGTADEQSISFDRQKRRALEDDCERVKSIMTGSPAKLVVTAPKTRQGQLFESASPNGMDQYARVSSRNRKTLTLGGTLGAMFPFIGLRLSEAEGVEQGRNLQNGLSLMADPFDRGGAPHCLTVAKSGSGKTYSVGKRAMRWWAADPERTLIFCDTMGGFAGITDLCNGQHIVVDGSKTINPLDIQSSATDDAHDDIDAFRMKVDEVTQFIAGILRAQGVDPGEYTSTIEELTTKTYAAAGIYPNQPETHDRESPTMADYIDTGVKLIEDEFELPDDAPRGGEQIGLDHERITENRNQYIVDLLTKLGGFKQGGKYEGLVGQTEERVETGSVTYLDLQQIEGSAGAEKSTMLQLMLGQVYQTVKNAPKKSMFVIDEAHYLLHSEEMLNWLQKAARHWRHYDACMWFCSQSPADFAPRNADGEGDESKETITGQCSMIEFGKTPELNHEIGYRFGMNDLQIGFVKNGAISGAEGRGFSQLLQSYTDIPGWVRIQVAASMVEHAVLTYDTDVGMEFAEYLYQTVGIDLLERHAHEQRPQLTAGSDAQYDDGTPSLAEAPDTDAEARAGVEVEARATADGEEVAAESNGHGTSGDDTAAVAANGGSPDSPASAGPHSKAETRTSGPENEQPQTVREKFRTDLERSTTEPESDPDDSENGAEEADMEAVEELQDQVSGSPATSESDGATRDSASPAESNESNDGAETIARNDGGYLLDNPSGADPQHTSRAETRSEADTEESTTLGGDLERTLTDLNGVGDMKAEALRSDGFETVSDVAAATDDELTVVDGVGPALAARMKADISADADADVVGDSESDADTPPESRSNREEGVR